MANKKVNTPKYIKAVEEKLDQTINKASDLHENAMSVTDTLVDEAYRAGTEWNKILQKAVKGGVKIYGKQQTLALDAIEGVVSQYGQGAKRFQKMIGFNIIKEVKAKATDAKEAVENMVAKVSDKVEHTMQNTEDTIKAKATQVKAKVEKVSKDIETQIATAKSDVEKKSPKATAKKVVKTTKKTATTKPASTPKAKATPSKSKKSTTKVTKKVTLAAKLTDIKGIGPKTQNILGKVDIKSVADLAKADAKAIDTLLASEGKIYATVNAQDWITEAKKLTK